MHKDGIKGGYGKGVGGINGTGKGKDGSGRELKG